MKAWCPRCKTESCFSNRRAKRKKASYCDDCLVEYLKEYRKKNWRKVKARDTWKGMIKRCHQPGHGRNCPKGVPRYEDYGAKGVAVCRRWRGTNGFENFLADVGLPSTKEETLDRIRPSRGYTPSNTRWVDKQTQQNNRRHVKLIGAECPRTGEIVSLTVAGWCRRLDMRPSTIYARIYRGWDPEVAVVAPLRADRGQHQPTDTPF